MSPAERQTSSAPADTEREPSSESAPPPASQALVKPEDLEPVEPGSSLKTLRTLRQPRAVPDQFTATSSLIGALSDEPIASSKSENKCVAPCAHNVDCFQEGFVNDSIYLEQEFTQYRKGRRSKEQQHANTLPYMQIS